uniref:Uncharacterized protein n=1 Tax=Arundo donax TaxID=35708 RepID=A0A0A9B792_ARUDO
METARVLISRGLIASVDLIRVQRGRGFSSLTHASVMHA